MFPVYRTTTGSQEFVHDIPHRPCVILRQSKQRRLFNGLHLEEGSQMGEW